MSWRWRTDHDYIILPEEYDKVFDGDIQKLAHWRKFFVLFNVMPPEGFVGHSALYRTLLPFTMKTTIPATTLSIRLDL